MDKIKALGARAGIVGGVASGLFMVMALVGEGAFADDPTAQVTAVGSTVTAMGTALLGVIVIAAGIVLAAKYIRKAAHSG